jgi:hypothetical protein
MILLKDGKTSFFPMRSIFRAMEDKNARMDSTNEIGYSDIVWL